MIVRAALISIIFIVHAHAKELMVNRTSNMEDFLGKLRHKLASTLVDQVQISQHNLVDTLLDRAFEVSPTYEKNLDKATLRKPSHNAISAHTNLRSVQPCLSQALTKLHFHPLLSTSRARHDLISARMASNDGGFLKVNKPKLNKPSTRVYPRNYIYPALDSQSTQINQTSHPSLSSLFPSPKARIDLGGEKVVPRRKGRGSRMRSPDDTSDTPLRDGNRDRLTGLLTERAIRTLLFYCSETNQQLYRWLYEYIKTHPIPRKGSWEEVSGEAFLRSLLNEDIELEVRASRGTGLDPMFDCSQSLSIDPKQVARRIMDIRIEIAKEFKQDLDMISDENTELLRDAMMSQLPNLRLTTESDSKLAKEPGSKSEIKGLEGDTGRAGDGEEKGAAGDKSLQGPDAF